jgi:hypothetical protein
MHMQQDALGVGLILLISGVAFLWIAYIVQTKKRD